MSILSYTQIQRFIAGTDLSDALKQDDQTIHTSDDYSTIEQAWQDISYYVLANPEYQDLLNDSYCQARSLVTKEDSSDESYMQGVDCQVGQPNSPGSYINLYAGTATQDGDSIDEDEQGVATLWGLINGQYTTLVNDAGDAYYDNPAGWRTGLWCNWSLNGNFQNVCEEWDGHPTDNGMYVACQGSVDQWAPYIHFNRG